MTALALSEQEQTGLITRADRFVSNAARASLDCLDLVEICKSSAASVLRSGGRTLELLAGFTFSSQDGEKKRAA